MLVGEVVQQLRHCPALVEDLSLVPTTLMAVTIFYNSSLRGFYTLFWLLRAPGRHVVHNKHRQNTYTH